MTGIIIILCVILIGLVLVQIGKVYELTAQIKGELETMKETSKWNGWISLVFLVVFLVGVIYSAYYYKNIMMGYGPHKSASEHGGTLDSLFNITLFFTGIVFVLTHIALFWFVYKYRWQPTRKAQFLAHDNRLEIWWTAIPAVVMTVLVVRGLNAWNMVMADVDPEEDYIEIEATAQQFGWIIRYPGPDGKLGARDFRLCKDNNSELGLDFTDVKTHDDVVAADPIMLPVNKKVRVRIISKDVLHNFGMPHFRIKMDAVPGMPTYFVFTPVTTTAQYREQLRPYPEFQVPFDLADPKGPKRWEKFDYELACMELCGKGHYSMRRIVKIVSQEEYDAWYKKQQSYYLNSVRGKKGDPFMEIDTVLAIEAKMRAKNFALDVDRAITAADDAGKTIRLNYVNFKTGSADLTATSRYELQNCVEALNKYPNMIVEVAGHTDNVGDPASNRILSQERAASVVNFLTTRGIAANRLKPAGYGDTKPLAPNDTPENRAKNRRTEFKILSN